MNSTKVIADQFGTDARTLRKFLRADGAGVGKGARYALPTSKRDLNALQKRFTAWDDARKAPESTDEVESPITDDAPESPTEG